MNHRPEIDAKVLFRTESHPCCDCCAGYCPEDDLPEKDRWDTLFAFKAAGVEYLGDRRIMVRRELLTGVPENVPVVETGMVDPDFAVAPASKPDAFVGKSVAGHVDRLDLASLECRGNDPKVIHIYAGDEHVGWTTVAKADAKHAITTDQLEQVRRIAVAARIGIHEAAVALATVQATQ